METIPAALAAYRAARVRWTRHDGAERGVEADGGGLEDAFDRLGRGPLLDAMAALGLRQVELLDGPLAVRVQARGDQARVQVAWEGAVAVDEQVPLGEDPSILGSAAFRAAHGVRWAYVAGAMAGGISSAALVIAMQRAGLLGFFGAGGLGLGAIEAAVREIAAGVDGESWGANLLHNPSEPAVEERTVDLYLGLGVRRVSASAFLGLTPAVVRYALHGIRRDSRGRIVRSNHLFAKVSRAEVAEPFLRPAPAPLLRELVERGALSADQARLAEGVPVAMDLTAEADSGGHTDHRPLPVVLPELIALRDRVAADHAYAEAPRVGGAGGLGTPRAVWGAFAMGADYVLTGSVNQATREAGTSDAVKRLLVAAGPADVATGPAPDMFELGAKVQVLSRGTMYAARAQRLYEVYRAAASVEEIPAEVRARLEKQLFRRSLDDVWAETVAYWSQRDPAQLERAEREPRHRMALLFRWYLGFTSRWARVGEADRALDYQVWCGPAMGAFNDWARGGPLEPLESRGVVEIATALMRGAAAERRRALAGR